MGRKPIRNLCGADMVVFEKQTQSKVCFSLKNKKKFFEMEIK